MTQAMDVFSILDKKKVSMIMEVIDEGIVKNPFHDRTLDSIRKIGFTQAQSHDIAECFFNFYSALQYPDKLKEQIKNVNIKEDTKQLITETFEEILEKGNEDVVAVMEKVNSLALFGHEHLQRFGIISEFRPIIENHKLQKVVMTVVVAGRIHESSRYPSTPFNFQMKLDEFENFVHGLNKRLEQIKMEVKILERKMGDDVVSL